MNENEKLLVALRAALSELMLETSITAGWLRAAMEAGGMTRAQIEDAHDKARAEYGPAIRATVEQMLPAFAILPKPAPADAPPAHRPPDPSAN